MTLTSNSNGPTRDTEVAQGRLVSPEWLASRLGDPKVRIVEIDVSTAAYDEWHIDGAVLWNIYRDLKDADYHPIDAAGLEQLVASSGIRSDSTIVFYGYAPAFGLWLMEGHGHADTRILNCSRSSWRAQGYPWSQARTQSEPGAYLFGPSKPQLRADRAHMEEVIERDDVTIADVRSLPEYDGDRFWPSGGMEPGGRAGHMPSAIHQPIDGIFDEGGAFRSIDELREVFSSIDVDGDGELITYCTIGGRAASAWFVLSHLLGRNGVSVYDGSWAEWGRTPSARVESP
jgi:thiosulfate/3-mercaptopyruvate sulfurtransferase